MLSTSIVPVPGADEMSVLVETSKVAMSPGPFGTVLGVQFAAVCQSPLVGLRFQVALPASRASSAPSESVRTMAHDRMADFMARIVPLAPFDSQADT